jgi:glycosyltransferase involved in cell wall biosynthesis
MDGVNIIYISRNGNIIQRNFRYIYGAYTWLKRNPSDVCFIKHFRGCSILKLLLPKLKFVFDIRTASVNTKPHTRFIYDKAMMFESYFFRHITVISASLSDKLNLSKKSYILPLGSEAISNTTKTFDSLRLLYVGTLDARDIDKTVSAFSQFYKHNKNIIKMNYTIVGDGPGDEIEQLKTIVEKNSLSDVVNIVGRVPFTELKPYFDTHNIGVSFVPLTEYFDFQPVTKTFDYLLSGMPVIATATSENKKVISSSNGVLIDDTVESFYKGLQEIWHEKESYNSDQIVSMSSEYNWSDIIDNLGDYLNKVSASK